jgi:hypothetical protein
MDPKMRTSVTFSFSTRSKESRNACASYRDRANRGTIEPYITDQNGRKAAIISQLSSFSGAR